MNTVSQAEHRPKIEELFIKAEQIKAEMIRAEEWAQNREQRHEQCRLRMKELEADGASRGKLQINREIMRKVNVGIRIAKSSLHRRHAEMRQCLEQIRDILIKNQNMIIGINENKLFDACE